MALTQGTEIRIGRATLNLTPSSSVAVEPARYEFERCLSKKAEMPACASSVSQLSAS